jgi:hypothetical protein
VVLVAELLPSRWGSKKLVDSTSPRFISTLTVEIFCQTLDISFFYG